eukprot:1137718-Pyramimonas_sp.AAC.1
MGGQDLRSVELTEYDLIKPSYHWRIQLSHHLFGAGLDHSRGRGRRRPGRCATPRSRGWCCQGG